MTDLSWPRPPPLPRLPSPLVQHGQVCDGRFGGRAVGAIDWSGLDLLAHRPPWWRRLRHKRWQCMGLSHESLFVGVAIVDLGWACTAFAYLFDRRQRRLLCDWSGDGWRGVSGGVSETLLHDGHAWFRGWRSRLSLRHEVPNDVVRVQVELPGLSLQAELGLQGSAPWLLAQGPVECRHASGGAAHATQKTPALAVQGWAQSGSQRWSLDSAVAIMDCSNGLLPRRTRWQWASAHRPGLGVNLQCGYFGDQENLLWLGDQCIALGRAEVVFDAAHPLRPWHWRTDDGLLDLWFEPEGARQDRRSVLGLVESHFVQPVGTFTGWVRPHADAPVTPVVDLPGMSEDHDSLW